MLTDGDEESINSMSGQIIDYLSTCEAWLNSGFFHKSGHLPAESVLSEDKDNLTEEGQHILSIATLIRQALVSLKGIKSIYSKKVDCLCLDDIKTVASNLKNGPIRSLKNGRPINGHKESGVPFFVFDIGETSKEELLNNIEYLFTHKNSMRGLCLVFNPAGKPIPVTVGMLESLIHDN